MNHSPYRTLVCGIVVVLAIGLIAILFLAVSSHRHVTDQTVNSIDRKDA